MSLSTGVAMGDYWHGIGDSKQAAKALWATADQLKREDQPRVEAMKEASHSYREKMLSNFDPGGWKRWLNYLFLRYNVVRACTDTVVAKLSLHEPAPQFTTFGGDQGLQKKAKGMTKLCEGVFQANDAYGVGRKVLRDCCLYPEGIAKVYDEDQDIKMKRRHPAKVFWDDCDIDGEPLAIYEHDKWSKESLLKRWPSKADDIAQAQASAYGTSTRYRSRDLIEVVEAYQRPWGSENGRHMVVLAGNVVLVDEPWEDQDLPYIIVRWSDDLVGAHGLSLWEQLRGIQAEIDFNLNKIADSMEKAAETYLTKHRGTEMNAAEWMSNERIRLAEWSGSHEPKFVTPPGVHPQMFQWLEQLYQRAFELAGVSQLSATSRKPADLESGAALRTFLDVETVRFSQVARAWEKLFVEAGRRVVKCARKLAGKNSGWAAYYMGKDTEMEKVEWKDVAMKDEQFRLRAHPVSALPQHPSARIQLLAELGRDQLITREEFLAYSDLPDTEKLMRLKGAPHEDLTRIFEFMLSEEGDYVGPMEFQQLATGIELGSEYWSRARCDGVDEKLVGRLERWLMEAKRILEGKAAQMMQLAQTQPQPGAGGNGGPAPQMPGPPPVGGPADTAAQEMLTPGATQ